MTFPTTPILDTFTRADGALGSNWTDGVDNDAAGLTIISNAAVGVFTGGTPSASAWNVSSFGPDMEVYCDIAVTPTGNDGPNLVLLSSIATGAGVKATYELGTRFPSTDSFIINRDDPGTGTVTLASFTQAYTAGDSIGISRVGPLITVWYKPSGGSWTNIGSVSDATYNTTGWFACVEYFGNTGGVSHFGGGNPSQTAPIAWIGAAG